MQKSNYDYDVIIVGGGVSGCSCAWNCARLGLKTLLVEKNSYLGGAITTQLVVPAMNTEHKNFNIDFFNELCKNAHTANAQICYKDGNRGWFNPLKLSQILITMLKNIGCEIFLDCSISNIESHSYAASKYSDKTTKLPKVLSVYIDTNYNNNVSDLTCIDKKHSNNISPAKKNKNSKYSAKYFIDATGDANLCDMLGTSFLPKESTQALSLRFIMSNVDKRTFAHWISEFDTNEKVTTVAQIGDEVHLSTAYTWDLTGNWALKPLFDDAVSKNILKDNDRAYFQIFSIAGEDDKIAFNCPRIISENELNPLNSDDKNKAKSLAIPAIERLKNFCNIYLKGFENAQIFKIADELGVRESRRVKGKYVLKKEDIYNAKKFKNPVAYSNYPIDVHSIKKDESILNYVQKVYSIPLECLIVDGFENLFVIGRCISADFYAQAAIRIQPTCFSMGEGLAKYLKLL